MSTSVMERPSRHVAVRSEEAIVAAVKESHAGGERVRPVGSRGSKSGIYETTGVALRLDGYDRLLAVRGSLVEVQAGMTCGGLSDHLRRHGLALPSWGEWREATVAGAIATGTHGGSGRYGIFPSSVHAVRLVTGDGQVIDVARGDPEFEHVTVSLGALGVISTITFECVERFRLRLETHLGRFDQYVRDRDRLDRLNEFHSAVWIPSAERVIEYSANRTSAPVSPGKRPERFSPTTLLLSFLSRRWGISALFTERRFNTTVVGEGDAILCPISVRPWLVYLLWRRAGRVQAVEFAIPLARATEALVLLDEMLKRHPQGLANAIGLRASGRDSFSLSPCYDRDTYWVDMFIQADNVAFVAALRALFEQLEARCHWGKHILLSPGYLRGQYPRWEAFRAARARLDPAGVFANRFTEEFELTAKPARGAQPVV